MYMPRAHLRKGALRPHYYYYYKQREEILGGTKTKEPSQDQPSARFQV